MITLNLFTKFYGILRNYVGVPFVILTPLRRVTRYFANKVLPGYLEKSERKEAKQETDVIVSFTSFPARIQEVWQVVECMLRQSCRPNKIILWLSKEQFPHTEDIPASLREREGECFNIRLVEEDIRSHKKYYYVSKEYPDSLVLLIDDDIYYPTDMVECLIKAYNANPNAIICQYGYIIKYDWCGCLLPYNQWQKIYRASEDPNLFFGSGGGTLFKPSSLYEDLTKKELFLQFTPIADDIWLNVMVRLAGLKCVMIKSGLILPVLASGERVNLCNENVGQGMNDIQIANVRSYYIKKMKVDPFSETINVH